MEALQVLCLIYPLYGGPVLLGGLLIWCVARKQIRLQGADWLLAVLPYALWGAISILFPAGKSLANLYEAGILGGLVLLLFAARVAFAIARPQRAARAPSAALIGASVAALAVWALVPTLPW
jgi:predicted Co/Zn/Cd cation transporter (cation efflux family)